MILSDLNTTADFVVALLTHYSFDRGGYAADELSDRWLEDYPLNWVGLAMIEALYQGRYKAISVEQILSFWSRRGQALYHFNHEFERLICDNFVQSELDASTKPVPPVSNSEEIEADDQLHKSSKVSRPFYEHGLPNSATYPAIEQFTPKTNGSDFYIKLKAIAQQKD